MVKKDKKATNYQQTIMEKNNDRATPLNERELTQWHRKGK